MEKKSTFNSFLISSIIIIGVILRTYHFFSLPFMYDELCEISNHYSSFTDLIQNGVKMKDLHPAGVYVFVYGWKYLFGNAEWIIKLPFLTLGIGCIYLTYRIGKDWFNESCGLIAATFISTLQFTIIYSTIIRPYISGLFFSLLMVICWTNYFFKPNKNRLINIVGFFLCSLICMYNHYFSFLFVIIVGFTGLFFLTHKNWKYYISSGILLILFFLPHLPITLYHLSIGGAGGVDGWLGPPKNDVLLTFIAYVFHYSFISGGSAAIIVLFYFSRFLKTPDLKNNKRLICVIWFMLPFLIGFFYSILINPVLEFSMLFFSFPFFIILISSFINEPRKWVITGLIIVISASNIYSLIYTRKHYELTLHQPSDEYAKYAMKLQKSFPKKKIFAILSTTERPFMEYYKKKYKINLEYHIFNPKDDTPATLYNMLKENSFDYLITGYLPEDYNALFKKQFTNLIHHSEGFTYDINCYSKKTNDETFKEKTFYSKTNPFNIFPVQAPWSADIKTLHKDSFSGNNFIMLGSMNEWGPGFNIPLNEITYSCTSKLLASINVKTDKKIKEAILVLQISLGDSILHWQGSNLNNYLIEGVAWQTIYTAYDIIGLDASPGNLKKYKLSVFLWNKGKQMLSLDNLSLIVKEGNPLKYGLHSPIN